MEYQVRKAEVKDTEGLFELNESFNGKGTNSKENILDSIKNNSQEIVIIATISDKPVGFICGQIFKSMCYGSYYGHISELYVKEELQRNGIGRRLMKGMEEEFKRNQIFYFQLFTGATNVAAQKFYSSLGYMKSEEWMYRKREV